MRGVSWLSLPSGMVALWAVETGSYALAVFATLYGGMCLYLGTEDG